MAGSQVTVALTQIEKQRLGYTAVSFSNIGADTECKIQAGSKVEIGGALFTFDAEEALTDWAGIGNDNDVYMKLVVAGTAVTAVFTTTVPTWSTSKQGWYNGLDRYIGGLYKDGSGNYSYKWQYKFMPTREGGNIYEVGEVIANIVKKKMGYVWCDGSTIDSAVNPEYTHLIYLLKKEAGADVAHPYYHADAGKAVLLDMRGAAIRGVDAAANRDKDGVRKSGGYQADKTLNHKHDTVMGSHGHNIRLSTADGSNNFMRAGVSEISQPSTTIVGTDLGTKESGDPKTGGATENIMKNIALYYLIKY